VEGSAYFVYILSAESINQRSFLPATHGTRFALHRSVERIQNLLMFVFCHGKEFYQVAHVAGPSRSAPVRLDHYVPFSLTFQPWLKVMEIAKAVGPALARGYLIAHGKDRALRRMEHVLRMIENHLTIRAALVRRAFRFESEVFYPA
jgi:hypothetical protein